MITNPQQFHRLSKGFESPPWTPPRGSTSCYLCRPAGNPDETRSTRPRKRILPTASTHGHQRRR